MADPYIIEPTGIRPGPGYVIEPVTPEPAPAPEALAASTIAPKGGVPHQPNIVEDQMQELWRRTMQEKGPTQPQDMSAAENLWRSGSKTYANNLLATPSIAADIASYPVRRGYALATGQERPNWFGATPRLDVDMLGAAARSATSDMTYDQARENISRNETAREESRPTSTTIGNLGGDLFTLAQGRAPFVSKLRTGEVAVEKAIKKGVPVSAKEPFDLPGSWRAAVKQSPGYNNFRKLLNRTAEAGAEGLALDALHEGGDPVQSAAVTAGAQFAGGGVAQALMHKFVPIPGMGRVANFALNTAALSQIFYLADVALPGEAKDYEAQRSAAQKILGGYIGGALLSTVTARARSGMVSVNMPRLTDALASAPRNAMQSYLVDYMNSDAAKKMDFKTKLTTMYNNIDKISPSQLRDLSAAFSGGNKDRFYNELDKATKGLTQ